MTTPPPRSESSDPARLHIGSGRERLEGWINIDIQALPEVDVIADVTQGLQFTDAEAIYAEHFLEHLDVDDAVTFLVECHRALAPGAWLRLSTPNLDWVWSTHYKLDADPAAKQTFALAINRAFHGWRHRFLWNREMLAEALQACGFVDVRWCRHGESELPVFQGIERHEVYDDTSDLPHVIIAEARRGETQPERLYHLLDRIGEEVMMHLAD